MLKIIENETIRQATKYAVVGGFCTIIDVALLFILTHFKGINYLVSSVISFMSGATLNYFLCVFWIFRIRVVKDSKLEFIFYVIISIVGLGINTGIIWILTNFFIFYYMLSKFVAIFFTYCWNFGARKYLLHTIK